MLHVRIALAASLAFLTPWQLFAQSGDGGVDPDRSQASPLEAQEAVARLEEILKRRPFHRGAFERVTQHHAETGGLAELVDRYRERAAALPGDVATRVLLARLQLRAGDAEGAVDTLGAIDELPVALERERVNFLMLRAEAAQRTGDFGGASVLLDEAMGAARTIAERLELAESLADMHLRAGDTEKAASSLRDAAAAFADQYLHRKRLADAMAQRRLDDAAIAEYQDLLALVENEPDKTCEVLRQLGLAHERQRNTDEAIHAYTRALDLLSSGHWMQPELQDRIVSLYRIDGRLDELIAFCRERVEASPSNTSLRALLAEVLAVSGDESGASEALAEAVRLFPEDRDLSERRVALLDRMGAAPEEIAAEYERIIGEHPRDAELYIAYGQHLAGSERLDDARDQWRRVLGSELTDATLALRLARISEGYGLGEDAVACYERAIDLAPDRPEPYTELARLHTVEGDRDAALAALGRMARARPDDAALHAERSLALLAMGMPEEAIAAMERAGELEPSRARYRLALSDLLIQSGDRQRAIEVRRAAIELMTNPVEQADTIGSIVSIAASAGTLDDLEDQERARLDDGDDGFVAPLVLARIADHRKDFSETRMWLERVLETNPSHEEARRQYARLHEASGDVDGAVEQYSVLAERHPSRARRYFQAIADLRVRYGDKAGAIDTFERMISAAPDNTGVLETVAEQIADLGDPERANGYYARALRLQPDRHDIRVHYAESLRSSGRPEDALTEARVAALQSADRDAANEALSLVHAIAGELGELTPIIDEFERTAQADPQRVQIARTAAQLLTREYEYTRAMDLLDAVLRVRPMDAELLIARGELLRKLARTDEAVEAYRTLLRVPGIDRDYALGELGKTVYEAGRVDDAKRYWSQISNKLYAGTLLANNELPEEAIRTFEEGLRIKPDDFPLRRHHIAALTKAGREREAIEARERLLDLEPGNEANVRDLAEAQLRAGQRSAAADTASRLFSPSVGLTTPQASAAQGSRSRYSYSRFGGPARTSFDRAVEFFQSHGLRDELEASLKEQFELQPDNAMLRRQAANLFSTEFGEPEIALELMRELETMEFPLEHRSWLGRATQRDTMRMGRYTTIARTPALRDKRLADLEDRDDLTLDGLLQLAAIRHGQGLSEQSIALLERAAERAPDDALVLGSLVGNLLRAERFADAEPHARRLSGLLAYERERRRLELEERVRREYVRGLPLELQVRVTDDLVKQIAAKESLGRAFNPGGGGVSLMGYFQTRLALATIFAETGRIDEAEAVWRELEPAEADADSWQTLANIAQHQEADDLAFEFYVNAIDASRMIAGDPLLRRVYGEGLMTRSWYSDGGAIDQTFNRLVESFAQRDRLVDLYDFLVETGDRTKAKRIREQYELDDTLIEHYTRRVTEERARFLASDTNPLERSTPYFGAVAKLAGLKEKTEGWAAASAVYESYLADFPDELEVWRLLSEVAEARTDLERAEDLELEAVACRERLRRVGREWTLRRLPVSPEIPGPLADSVSEWEWNDRWGDSYGSSFGYGPGVNERLSLTEPWLRIARMRLAQDNIIGVGDAMERAFRAAGTERDYVAYQVLNLVRQRQLVGEMLPVLRSLAVHLPTNQALQMAFAESLEANDQPPVALDVYRRMLRRGVSDLGVLSQIRQSIARLDPDSQDVSGDTIETLEAKVAAEPRNANEAMRLAKAYFYSLRIDDAAHALDRVQEIAPHLEETRDLRLEIATLRNDPESVRTALLERIESSSDPASRRAARQRLVRELMMTGRTEEAIAQMKVLGDPSNPSSYENVGMMLAYFGRLDEAMEQFELSSSSRSGGGYSYGYNGGASLAHAKLLAGDVDGAADEILSKVKEAARSAQQYSSPMYAMGYGGGQENPFQQYLPLFVLEPGLETGLLEAIRAEHEAAPNDLGAAKLYMQFCRIAGRPDLADALLERVVGDGSSDQQLVTMLIDKAIREGRHGRAITLGEAFIANQPDQQLPPGMPPEYADRVALTSPRRQMLCKIGDVHWDLGDPEKAFDAYRQIVDDKIVSTRLAYATICLLRGRIDEARAFVDEAQARETVKSPQLLRFRAAIVALEGDEQAVYDALEEAEKASADESGGYYGFRGYSGGSILETLADRYGMQDRYVSYLRERVEESPSEFSRAQTLATTLAERGRFDEAVGVLDRAAEQPENALQARRAKLAMMKPYTAPQELVPLYRAIIEDAEKHSGGGGSYGYYGSVGNDAPERETLAALLWELGRQDEAIGLWTERMNERSAASHARLGMRLLDLAAQDRARDSFERAIELQPDHTGAHRALALLAHRAGDHDAAFAHMREVFEDNADEFIEGGVGNNYSRGYPGYNRGYGYYWQDVEFERWRMLDLAASRPSAPAPDTDPDEATRDRLMVALWEGDWDAIRRAAADRTDALPYDVLGWKALALSHERSGRWDGAAEAWAHVQRIERTSLPDRHDQLELILAGGQVSEAASGTRQAQPGSAVPGSAGGAGGYYGGYSRGYYGGYSGSSDVTTRLAKIHTRAGDIDRAERIYLARGMSASALPSLAQLFWREGERERAVELLRLSALFASEASPALTYAAALAESGEPRDAVRVIERAFRFYEADTGYAGYFYGYGYGGLSGPGRYSGGDWREKQYAAALHTALRGHELLDGFIAELRTRLEERPSDVRSWRLLADLLESEERWAELRDVLTAWRDTAGDLEPILDRLYEAHVRLADADAAIAVAREAAPNAGERAIELLPREAFAHLAAGDREAAAEVASRMRASDFADQEPWRTRIMVLLAVTGDTGALDRLAASHINDSSLSDEAMVIALGVLTENKRWDTLATAGANNLWRTQDPLSEDLFWFRVFETGVRSAHRAGSPVVFDDAENQAMARLVTEGPRAGVRALRAVSASDPDNINPLRGLVFASHLAGDAEAAAAAAGELVQRLEEKSTRVWRPGSELDMGEVTATQLRMYTSQGVNAQTVLSNVGDFESILQQLLGAEGGYRSDNAVVAEDAVLYRDVWATYLTEHAKLLQRTGRTDELRVAVKDRTRLLEAMQIQSNRYSYWRPNSNAWGVDDDISILDPDDAVLRAHLVRSDERGFVEACEARGDALDERWWPPLIEAYIGLGDEEKAGAWRRRAGDAALAQMLVSDRPGMEDPYGYWYYGGIQHDSQRQASTIVSALRSVDLRDDQNARDRRASVATFYNASPALLLDERIAGRLERHASDIGPGWDSTSLLGALVVLHELRGDHARVIELVERANGGERLAASSQLAPYLRACFHERDEHRIIRVLDDIAELGEAVRDECRSMRLGTLRYFGHDEEADTLEAKILAEHEDDWRNPSTIDEPLARAIDATLHGAPIYTRFSESDRYRRSYGYNQTSLSYGIDTMNDLDALLGVGVVSDESGGARRGWSLSTMLENLYTRLALHEDALRIVRVTEERSQSGRSQRRQAYHLRELGLIDEARALMEGEITELRARIDRGGWERGAARRLIELHADVCDDPERALAELVELKRTCTLLDADGLLEARIAHAAGDHARAWRLYARAMDGGAMGAENPSMLYQAGLSGMTAGDPDRAARLLRRALWRAPDHERADEAREALG